MKREFTQKLILRKKVISQFNVFTKNSNGRTSQDTTGTVGDTLQSSMCF